MSVLLVVGGRDDAVLVAQAVRDAVHELVGDADPALMVEEHSVDPDDEAADASPVADAARTLPFLTERRVVVARNVEAYGKDGLRPLLSYLEDPSPTTDLVLACTGTAPKALRDAVKAAGGEQRSVAPPTRKKETEAWWQEHLRGAPVQLAPAAVAAVEGHLGQDLGRLDGLLATLASAYGEGARLGVDEVAPYLGEAGAVPPWGLTDAIDGGRMAEAVAVLHRLLGPSGTGMHPLQVLAVLHGHYRKVLRLEGSGITARKEAAAVVGGPEYPAEKALATARRLGHDGVARALHLLAAADVDLKGRSGVDERTTLEVLVARLARLARA